MDSFIKLSPRGFFAFLDAYIEYLRQKANGDEPDLGDVPQEAFDVMELFDRTPSSTIINLCILNAETMFKLMELENGSEDDEDSFDNFCKKMEFCEECPFADECPYEDDDDNDDDDEDDEDDENCGDDSEEEEDAECFRAAMTAFINELSKHRRIPKNIVFEVHEATDEEMRKEKGKED